VLKRARRIFLPAFVLAALSGCYDDPLASKPPVGKDDSAPASSGVFVPSASAAEPDKPEVVDVYSITCYSGGDTIWSGSANSYDGQSESSIFYNEATGSLVGIWGPHACVREFVRERPAR
jgi:hypothetical protein